MESVARGDSVADTLPAINPKKRPINRKTGFYPQPDACQAAG